jgi:hypothetical protein
MQRTLAVIRHLSGMAVHAGHRRYQRGRTSRMRRQERVY